MEDLIPPGFRFYPTEEELISFYLHHKLEQTRPELNHVIPIVDIYALEPWELPRLVGERCSRETEQWFFFTPQQEREARGGKPNRTTASGYWKATGSPGYVVSSSQKRAIGVKKTMVFYKGRAPTGRKTKWKMNEYKSILGTPQENIPSSSNNASTMPKLRHEMSLCRVYITSGSSRAFDRRPSALTIRRPIPDPPSEPAAPAAPTPARASDVNFTEAVPDKSSSASGSSSYGGEERVVVDNRQMEDAGSSNNIDVMSHEILSGLEPFWEWEQLNWP